MSKIESMKLISLTILTLIFVYQSAKIIGGLFHLENISSAFTLANFSVMGLCLYLASDTIGRFKAQFGKYFDE